MKNFEPIRKSFIRALGECSWRADQIHCKGVESATTKIARHGIKGHNHWTEWSIGRRTLDEALTLIAADPEEEDREAVEEIVRLAIERDPIKFLPEEKKTLEVEWPFKVDIKGKPVNQENLAALKGTIDRIWRRGDGVVCVDDLKTGWGLDYDNPLERYFYILGAKSAYPNTTNFHFSLFFPRFNEYRTWKFRFSDKDHVLMETHPDGRMARHWFGNNNPLVVYLQSEIEKCRKLVPTPNPGPHCEDYYGEPCQFNGNDCPEAKNLPAIVEKAIEERTKEPATPFEMLRGFIDGSVKFSKAEVQHAYSGVLQFKGFVKAVEKAVQEWSKANGPLQIGDGRYGWFTTPENEVDKEYVLGELFALLENGEIDIAGIAKVVNVSKSSLEKMSKRQYGDVRDQMLTFGVNEVASKPKFGAIKEEKEIEQKGKPVEDAAA